MFTHIHELQLEAQPDRPDPAFACRFQEVLGGKWGEMTVAMQYLYQGWSCRLPGKYKDMLLDIGTEELAHVEMITTCIDRLLDASPMSEDDAKGKTMKAEWATSNPQHQIENGGGVPQGQQRDAVERRVRDRERQPLRRLHAERHRRDAGPAAGGPPLPHDRRPGRPEPVALPAHPRPHAPDAVGAGAWAHGPAYDGRGEITVQETMTAHGDRPNLPPGDPRLYGTPPVEPATLLERVKDLL